MSTCPRCDQAELVIDDVDGFLLCPECGFVADEYPLQQQPQGLGTIVLDNDTGKSAARKLAQSYAHALCRHETCAVGSATIARVCASVRCRCAPAEARSGRPAVWHRATRAARLKPDAGHQARPEPHPEAREQPPVPAAHHRGSLHPHQARARGSSVPLFALAIQQFSSSSSCRDRRASSTGFGSPPCRALVALRRCTSTARCTSAAARRQWKLWWPLCCSLQAAPTARQSASQTYATRQRQTGEPQPRTTGKAQELLY